MLLTEKMLSVFPVLLWRPNTENGWVLFLCVVKGSVPHTRGEARSTMAKCVMWDVEE